MYFIHERTHEHNVNLFEKYYVKYEKSRKHNIFNHLICKLQRFNVITNVPTCTPRSLNTNNMNYFRYT